MLKIARARGTEGRADEPKTPQNGARIEIATRPFKPMDRETIYATYIKAFAEPPWNETWTPAQVRKDLEYALRQDRHIVIVAQVNGAVAGFTWGYTLIQAEFPFLSGRLCSDSVYMDEIAVDPALRRRGVGSSLSEAFEEASSSKSFGSIVLRTDEANVASMELFHSQGFESLGVYDPEFPSRLYLKKDLRG